MTLIIDLKTPKSLENDFNKLSDNLSIELLIRK